MLPSTATITGSRALSEIFSGTWDSIFASNNSPSLLLVQTMYDPVEFVASHGCSPVPTVSSSDASWWVTKTVPERRQAVFTSPSGRLADRLPSIGHALLNRYRPRWKDGSIRIRYRLESGILECSYSMISLRQRIDIPRHHHVSEQQRHESKGVKVMKFSYSALIAIRMQID